MRKDVKFGLTIGGILVVTLVVYVVVLSRGGDKNPNTQEVKLVTIDGTGTPGGQQAPAVSHDPAPGEGAAPRSADPSGAGLLAPATEPSVAVRNTDWDTLMEKGPPALAAPADPGITTTRTPDTAPGGRAVVSVGGHPSIDTPNMLDNMPGSNTTGDGQTGHLIVDVGPVASNPATMPSVLEAGPRKHKIAAGETLSTISHAVYGDSKHWDKILGANPGLDPKHLKIGTVLVIPDITNLPISSAASDHGADLPPPGEGTSTMAAPLDPSTSYKVVSGDSLEKIAIKLYGKADMKDKIYETNKTLMGEDEDRLKIGWVLKLPTPPTDGAPAARPD